MRGVAIEYWKLAHRRAVTSWLIANYGQPGVEKRWYIDNDYGLVNLMMDEDVYIMYSLKWSEQ
jgi:hypothetical protein